MPSRNLLTLLALQVWLTSLDNFRNWLIRAPPEPGNALGVKP
jgi:hypothetical protein